MFPKLGRTVATDTNLNISLQAMIISVEVSLVKIVAVGCRSSKFVVRTRRVYPCPTLCAVERK